MELNNNGADAPRCADRSRFLLRCVLLEIDIEDDGNRETSSYRGITINSEYRITKIQGQYNMNETWRDAKKPALVKSTTEFMTYVKENHPSLLDVIEPMISSFYLQGRMDEHNERVEANKKPSRKAKK